MLKNLYIKDYALIDEIDVGFHDGLNIILGETGAGKSILIGALGLLIGERASTEAIRNGRKKAIVEGVFEISALPRIKAFLDEIDIDYDDELIIRREISTKGSNRIFLNDTPVNLSDIKTLGEMLVDLHGQHSHQSLLKSEKHVEFLDELGNYRDLLEGFREKISLLENKRRELKALLKRETELKEKLELYEFKLNEINEVNPQPGEDEQLASELRILENSEFLFNATAEIYAALYESENAVYDNLSVAEKKVSDLVRYDETFRAHADDLANMLSAISEIAEFMRDYKEKLEIDPEIIAEKRERLGALNLLKKKYGGSLDSVLEFREKISEEISLAQNFSFEAEKIKNEIARLQKEAGETAFEISKRRRKTADEVAPKIVKALENLGMNDALFDVEIRAEETDLENGVLHEGKSYAYNHYGIDNVEFMISANPGEEPKPLIKIASGGEISRIMLALKTLLARKDGIPLLIFDEIDTGISGRIAQKAGAAMRDLAKTHQIIAITHLPQIAAYAEHLYLIEKQKENERAVSKIKKLEGDEILREIARLISGEKITDAALESAKQLLPR